MNIAKMMKQAQQMQAGMLAKQEELAAMDFEAKVGGDKVTVVASGSGEVKSITIDPSLVDPDDVEFLQDLVLKGVQEAIALGKKATAEEMGKLTGGMGMPPGL